jgi:hypothetical protein
LGNNGGGGRFLLGSNAGTGTTGINLTGASTTTFSGPTTGNPFVKGTPQTPYIPNLASGAEGFGLLSGVDATSAQFAGVRAGAPAHAVGAIIREHLGPTPGYDTDFAGYDALLFVNLTAGELAEPMLGDDPAGTDTAFMSALLTGGTEAQWFGSGATTLGLLDGEAIWETLIPTDGDFINASADGTVPIVGDALADGGVASGCCAGTGDGGAVRCRHPGTGAGRRAVARAARVTETEPGTGRTSPSSSASGMAEGARTRRCPCVDGVIGNAIHAFLSAMSPGDA